MDFIDEIREENRKRFIEELGIEIEKSFLLDTC
jgi:hypothetical protein